MLGGFLHYELRALIAREEPTAGVLPNESSINLQLGGRGDDSVYLSALFNAETQMIKR